MGISTVASYRGAQVFEAVGLAQDLVDAVLHRHARRSSAASASTCSPPRSPRRHARRLPAERHRAGAPRAGRRRRVPVAPRGRAAPVRPGDGVPAAARHPRPALRRLQAVHRARRRAGRAADDAARAVPVRGRRSARRCRSTRSSRSTRSCKRFSTGAMSLRLDLAGGARDAGHRDEPARRASPTPARAARTPSASCRCRTATRSAPRSSRSPVGPVRRDQRVPGQRRRHPDQDGPGRQARRGRPAARPQGLPVDRQDPALHAGRRADLAAAAPRHLLDRGPGPADPRPQERQPAAPACTSSWSSEVGVGTVAAGVAKAHADVVLISGHDGGTGASPLTSLKHAGAPWELGLAETQQTLLLNGLRDRVVVQIDGQLKTGRDVVVAALLGAEEFGFATAPLVVMRLRDDAGLPPRHLPGRRRHPEPGAARAVQRQAGVRRDLLRVHRRGGARATSPRWASARSTRRSATPSCSTPRRARRPLEGRRASTSAPILHVPELPTGARPAAHDRARTTAWTRPWTTQLIAAVRAARWSTARRCARQLPVRNVNRTVGTMLGSRGHPALRRRRPARRHDRPHLRPARPASRSARSCPRGITLRLEGDANDYVGKGLSGGRVVVRPDRAAAFAGRGQHHRRQRHRATARPRARSFLRGRVGERFCVRNSGATAVVEGVGDHGCEYMTGGRVVDPRPDRAQLRAPACPAASPTCSTSTRRWSTPSWSTSSRCCRRRRTCCTRSLARGTPRRPARAVAAALLADWDARAARGSPRSCPATTSGCSTAAGRGRAQRAATDRVAVMEASRG